MNTLPLAVSLVLKSLPLAVSHVNIHEWEVTSLGLLFLSLHQILTTCCLLSMHIDEKCPIIVHCFNLNADFTSPDHTKSFNYLIQD